MKDTELKAKIDGLFDSSKGMKDAVVMATIDSEMRPRMRFMVPMSREGNIFYFGTSPKSRKVEQIKQNKNVQLLFNKQMSQMVLAEGKCILLDDQPKKTSLWNNCVYNPKQFWKGPEDPDFSVLKVNLTHAEYMATEPQWIQQEINL